MSQEEHAELVTRMFALMTSKLEDAAGDAAVDDLDRYDGMVNGLRYPVLASKVNLLPRR